VVSLKSPWVIADIMSCSASFKAFFAIASFMTKRMASGNLLGALRRIWR